MGEWPGNKARIFKDILPCYLNEDGSGLYCNQVELYEETGWYNKKKGSEIIEIINISAVLLLTGYRTDVYYLDPELYPVWLKIK